MIPQTLSRRAPAVVSAGARAFSTSSPRGLARLSVIGNLADTPEVRTTQGGREYLRYAVATNSGPRENRRTSWFHITSFQEGPRREFMLSLPKGSMVHIDADASVSSFQDSEGQSRVNMSFIQRTIEVLKRPAAPASAVEMSESGESGEQRE